MLAAVSRETQEKYPSNGQSRTTPVLRINGEHITQLSEKIEGRVAKTLSQEFSKTEARYLSSLSKLNESLLNPRIRTLSGTVPVTFWTTGVENSESTADCFRNDPPPEVEFSIYQFGNLKDSDLEEASHIREHNFVANFS